jgi:hypothetical protein
LGLENLSRRGSRVCVEEGRSLISAARTIYIQALDPSAPSAEAQIFGVPRGGEEAPFPVSSSLREMTSRNGGGISRSTAWYGFGRGVEPPSFPVPGHLGERMIESYGWCSFTFDPTTRLEDRDNH